jgi:hypothetical protein
MQFDNKTRNPVSRGRPPTGSMKHNAMFALARDGTRWRHIQNSRKRAGRASQISKMLPLPEVSQKVQDIVVINFVHRRAYTARFPEIEYLWIQGSGYRFYCSGFKDPPVMKDFSFSARVEKPPNMEFQSFGFAYCRKGKLIKPCRRKFISGFWSQRFRSARDWVNITCTGEYLWKPDRDNYTSSISASYHTVWCMDHTAGLMIMQDPDSSGLLRANTGILTVQPAISGLISNQLE